jgi:hypothetical protein
MTKDTLDRARYAGLAALIALVGALAGFASSSAARPASSAKQDTDCPSTGPQGVSTNPWSEAHHAMAPAGAQILILCRYNGLNSHPPLSLVVSRRVGPKARRQLISDFDALKALRGVGPIACPADNGSEVVAEFAYAGGHSVEIATRLRGCQPVTNGDINRLAANIDGKNPAGPRLIALLKRLIPRPPPVPNGY